MGDRAPKPSVAEGRTSGSTGDGNDHTAELLAEVAQLRASLELSWEESDHLRTELAALMERLGSLERAEAERDATLWAGSG